MGSSGSKGQDFAGNVTPIQYHQQANELQDDKDNKNLKFILGCEQWREVEDLPWETVTRINFDDRDLPDLEEKDVALILSRCGVYLLELSLHSQSKSSIMTTEAFRKRCRNLKSLECAGFSSLNEEDFVGAFAEMRQLESFIVRVESLSEKRTVSLDYDKILSSLREKVKSISITTDKHCVWVSEPIRTFPTSMKRFKALNELSLAFFELDDEALETLSSLETLAELHLIECRVKEGTTRTISLPNLVYLTFSKMSAIDNFLIYLPQQCENIARLDIDRCEPVSEPALQELTNLKALRVLDLGGIENARDTLLENLSNLRLVRLTFCPGITDSGVMKLIKNSPNLKYLFLSETNITVKSIEFAARETRRRNNNTTLTFITDRSVARRFDKLKNPSANLDVQAIPEHH